MKTKEHTGVSIENYTSAVRDRFANMQEKKEKHPAGRRCHRRCYSESEGEGGRAPVLNTVRSISPHCIGVARNIELDVPLLKRGAAG